MVCEPSWTAEVRPASSDLLPQRPGAAVRFALQNWGRVHRTQTGSLDHGSKCNEDKILLVHFDLFRPAFVFTSDASDSVIFARITQSEIRDTSIERKFDSALLQPLAQRPDHRVILVVDGSHYPGEGVET